MATLTAEERAALPDSAFAVPEKRLLPIHDAAHARLAWAMLERTEGLTAEEKARARARILRALRRFGVPLTPAMEEAEHRVLADTREAVIADAAGHLVEVTIARPGVSRNGYVYSEAVLRDCVELWNGAPAFLDHPTALDLTRAGARSLRDLVGVYEGAFYESGRGLRARLRLMANDHGAFETIREAIAARAAGRPAPPIGISADWRVLVGPSRPGPDGRPRRVVQGIVAVNSGDLVIHPSAGGSFDRILEAAADAADDWMREGIVTAPLRDQTLDPDADRETGRAADGTAEAPGTADVARLVDEATRPLRLALAESVLASKLAASGLPEPAAAHLRQQFSGRVFEAAELDAAIAGLREMLGAVFGQQSIRGVGAGVLDPGRPQGITPLEKIQAAFDRLLGLEVPSHLAAVPRLSGVREAYIAITGDRLFEGRYHWEESVVREANETTTNVMANVVLNSMTKRLIRDYQAQPRWWEPICVKVAVSDMKQQHRIRLNDFGALAAVAEDGTYQNIQWGDARENYTPTKFGNIVHVTLEMFLNDDLHAIQRIPTKLAHAAVVTVNEQVAGLFLSNGGAGAVMSDGYTVFDAVHHQGNVGTTTEWDLSPTALQNAMTVLEKMENSAGKRIGVRGRYLLIPPELRWQAQTITQSPYLAGTANNDINPLAGAVIPIVVPQFTTPFQWYLLADPSQVESIEIGFLNGREEPELLVQDSPTAGAVFTNDAISFKVRHVFGWIWSQSAHPREGHPGGCGRESPTAGHGPCGRGIPGCPEHAGPGAFPGT